MKPFFLLTFCLVTAISLALASATFMAGNFESIFTGVGLLVGMLLGIIIAPISLVYRKHPRIFEMIAVVFTVSFPIAILSGFTRIPWVAIGLTAFTALGVFFVLVRDKANSNGVAWNKYVLLIFVTSALLGGTILYEQNRLPNDPNILIEMLAENNIPTHLAVGRRLMNFGKEPLLVALRHRDGRVRGRAAQFLGLLHDKTVIDDLIDASDDDDPYVRNRIAFALGELQDSRSVPTLQKLAQDQDRAVQHTANKALEKLARSK